MTDTARCETMLLTQADHDGELDAAQAAAVAAHVETCPICQAESARLQSVRQMLKTASYRKAPAALRERLMQQLQAGAAASEPRPPRPAAARPGWPQRLTGWRQALGGFGVGAAAAAALLLVFLSPGQQAMVDQIVAGHVRSLQPGHLEDVVSTDQHTVKPWFDGRVDFAPPVKDLADRGFPLEGGRLDYIDGRTVAALVYGHGKHPINLFVWPVDRLGDRIGDWGEQVSQRNGYNIVHWVQNKMDIWAVSDLNRAELRDFAQIWRSTP